MGLTSDSLLNSRLYTHCLHFMIIFPDYIIICYSHNHIMKLVKFYWQGGAVAPAALHTINNNNNNKDLIWHIHITWLFIHTFKKTNKLFLNFYNYLVQLQLQYK